MKILQFFIFSAMKTPLVALILLGAWLTFFLIQLVGIYD